MYLLLEPNEKIAEALIGIVGDAVRPSLADGADHDDEECRLSESQSSFSLHGSRRRIATCQCVSFNVETVVNTTKTACVVRRSSLELLFNAHDDDQGT